MRNVYSDAIAKQSVGSTKISWSALADHGEKAAGLAEFLFLKPVGKEQVGAVHCAERRGIDRVERDAAGEQLIFVSEVEIDERVPIASLLKVLLASFERRGESVDHVFADLVIAAPGGRADRGGYIFWLTAKLRLHLLDRLDDNGRDGSTPTGMNGGKGSGAGVADQNRHAIGSLDADKHAAHPGNQPVESFLAVVDIGLIFNDLYVVAVNLPGRCEFEIAADRIQESPPILVNIVRGIFVKTGKIKRVFRKIGHAAQPGRKAVDETLVFERPTHNHPDAFVFSPKEARVC